MTFQVGDKVVYPNQGVATIENISSRSFGAQFEPFYLLRLTFSSMTVMVPFSHVEDVGLRRVTKNHEIDRVLWFLSKGACQYSQDWKNRFKENSDKMRNGGLLEVAEVLKGLVTEISIGRRVRESEAVLVLERALQRASLALPPLR